MFIPMEVENSESRYFTDESSEFDRIVKLIQSSRSDAADLIFEELKKSIKRKGRWSHDNRVWPHENGKSDKSDKNKRKLKIVDNQELYTRFVPAAARDGNKSPAKESKRDKSDDTFDPTKEDAEKTENKRLTATDRNDANKEEHKEQTSKKIKTESSSKSKDEPSVKSEKTSGKSADDSNGKADKYPAASMMDDDVELLLSLSNGDQDEVEPKTLRKRKETKKENPSLHKISNGGVQKKKAAGSSAPVLKTGKGGGGGGEPLFNLKENMKTIDGDSESGKNRQKMFYGSTQVTRRDKPRREGTLADDSKKRLEAKLKKVKAKLKKSI